MNKSPEKLLSTYWPLLSILICLFILQALFFAGVTLSDDLSFLARAARAANAARSGPSQVTSLAIPIFCALLNVIMIYHVTTLLANRKAALLASLLWAFFPLSIFFSTGTLTVTPVTTLFLLVMVFIIAFFIGGNKLGLPFAAFGALGLLLYEPWLLLGVAFLIFYFLLKTNRFHQWQRVRIPVLGIFAILLLLPGSVHGFLQFYGLIREQAEFVFFLPLFIVSMVFLPAKKDEQTSVYLVWAGSVLISWMAKAAMDPSIQNATLVEAGPYLLAVCIPLVILSAIFLSKRVKEKQAGRVFVSLGVLVLFAAFLAVQGTYDFLPDFDHLNWIGLPSLFLIYSIFSGLAFLGILLSPLLVERAKGSWRGPLTILLISVILLASLSATWTRQKNYRYKTQASALAWEFLRQLSENPLIYTVSADTNILISLQADFTERNSYQTISEDQISKLESAYLVAFEDELASPEPNWFAVARFGALSRPRIVLYYIGPDVSPEPITSNYAAAINMGEYCSAYAGWVSSFHQVNAVGIVTLPFNTDSDCLTKGPSLADLQDLQEVANRDGYLQFTPQTEPAGLSSLTMEQRVIPVFDQRTISIELLLEPNTLYLYSIEVRTSSPTAILYWKQIDQQDYLEMNRYLDWAQRGILLLTPSWEHAERVTFSPVLFDHLDQVSLRNFYIGKVEIDGQD